MPKGFLTNFITRWIVCAFGLWVAAAILGPDRMSVGDSVSTVAIAGLFMALVNMAIKPALILFSLPAVILTLGLFMLIINGFLVILVSWLYDPVYVKNFGVAIIAGIILGLINFLVSRVMEEFE